MECLKRWPFSQTPSAFTSTDPPQRGVCGHSEGQRFWNAWRSKVFWKGWPLSCNSTREPSEVRIMSLDGQVLVIAVFAVALKLSLWSSEDVVGVDVEPDRKDVLHLDD